MSDEDDWKGSQDDLDPDDIGDYKEDDDEEEDDEDDFEDAPKKKKSPKTKTAPKKKAPAKAKASPKNKRKATKDEAKTTNTKKSRTAVAAPSETKQPSAPLVIPASVALSSAANTAAYASSVAAMAAGLPKGTVVSGDKAKTMVLEYMKEQNRPYAHTQVWENLHRVIKKAQVPTILQDLANEGHLEAKTFKKNVVFVANQSNYPEVDPAEIQRIDQQLDEMTRDMKSQEELVKSLEQEIARSLSEPSDAEADRLLTTLAAELESKSARLAQLSSGQTPITQADLDKRQKLFNLYYKEWTKRKRAALEMIATHCENITKKPKKVMEEWGVETDEEVGTDSKKFEPLYKMMK